MATKPKPESFAEVIRRREIERREQLQRAINRVNEITLKACRDFENLTWGEVHGLRAAATSWAEQAAGENKLLYEGDPATLLTKEERSDRDGDTARYILDPF